MRPVRKRDFIRVLKKLGLQFLRNDGSHELWDKRETPLARPVTMRRNDKDIPSTHIKTNIRTLGLSWKEFEKILQNL